MNVMSAHTGPWSGFSAFQVFGDHLPMNGFCLVLRLVADPQRMQALLAARGQVAPNLDPELARVSVRAGLGLVQTGAVQFAYANAEEAVVLVDPAVVQDPGSSLVVHDKLVSTYSARATMILGTELPVTGYVYEFPNKMVFRRALMAAQETYEEDTPRRCSIRLGAQMQGRGEPFHPSMVESIEEQTALLESQGVDMESLPAWWWRGVAVRVSDSGLEVFDDLPSGDEFAAMVPA